MFDRPEWWQVLLLITPISLAIQGIRWREAALSNSSFKSLTPAQKGFVLLHYMPPGKSAEIWREMPDWEREGYLAAGQEIRGSGKHLIAPLVKDVVKTLTEQKRKPPSTESNDPLEKLALAADFNFDDLKILLRDRYPVTPEASPREL